MKMLMSVLRVVRAGRGARPTLRGAWMRRGWVAAVLTWCCIGEVYAAEVRVLFVGNSYTGQIRKVVTEMVAASPHAGAELAFITPGGKSLSWHLENGEAVSKIREGDWDFVVLQDQSQTPAVFPEKFADAAEALDEIIDESGAMTVFYMTWGRRDGDKENKQRFPDYESMQKALTTSYAKAGKKADARVARVGEVWERVREADPELGKALYKQDGSHPSTAGAYLAACVFYATIFGEDPAEVAFDGGLAEEDVKVIRRAVGDGLE